jgi:hypothetical protein
MPSTVQAQGLVDAEAAYWSPRERVGTIKVANGWIRIRLDGYLRI